MQRIVIQIKGVVQGVLFRQNCKSLADTLGLVGFARNEKDGSVTIVAEGEQEALQNLAAWAHSGPQHSVVEDITETKNKATGEFESFNIF